MEQIVYLHACKDEQQVQNQDLLRSRSEPFDLPQSFADVKLELDSVTSDFTVFLSLAIRTTV